jgi:hypothetical protein
MAQGAVKKSSKPITSKKYATPPAFPHPSSLPPNPQPPLTNPPLPRPTGPKRGARVIKPKKSSLISQQKIKKKHAAGLTAQTEKMLGEKAGHLEMLRGGKKERKAGAGTGGEGKGKK